MADGHSVPKSPDALKPDTCHLSVPQLAQAQQRQIHVNRAGLPEWPRERDTEHGVRLSRFHRDT